MDRNGDNRNGATAELPSKRARLDEIMIAEPDSTGYTVVQTDSIINDILLASDKSEYQLHSDSEGEIEGQNTNPSEPSAFRIEMYSDKPNNSDYHRIFYQFTRKSFFDKSKARYLNSTKFEQLKPGPTAQDLMNFEDALYVTHFYSFEEVHVVQVDAFKNILLLNNEILKEIRQRTRGKCFEFPPKVGTVLIAPLDGIHARAVVTERHPKDFCLYITVHYFDLGGEAKLPFKSCYHINDTIRDVPILGLRISLKGVTSRKTDRIHKSDFDDFVLTWPAKRPCKIKSVEITEGKVFAELQYVITKSISTEILNLGK